MSNSMLSLAQDGSEPLVGNYFVAVYPPFACWSKEHVGAALCRLSGARSGQPRSPLGLYIHVPFCVERCDFCYYRSYAGQSGATRERYLDAVLTELSMYRSYSGLAERRVDFVYFGGGTPSLLSVRQIERLLRGIQAVFPWTHAREVTLECAPKSVSRSRLAALAEAGVTRISLGVQQLDDGVLLANGRIHRVDDAERAFAKIASVEFQSVNVDLIVGLVGETDATFRTSLNRVLQWQPDSVTIYQLEIPVNTPLAQTLREGHQPPAGWDVKRRRLMEAWDELERAGYTLRSAYTAVRDPTKHHFYDQDLQYQGADLLGVGVASFSYVDGVHCQNIASIESYQASVADRRLPLSRAYVLSEVEQMTREFILQMKLGQINARYFAEKFSVDL
ncbi:MAG: coproporphyrinogen III oxidase family protein, partial [Planctomycetales bacterium]|nr:coproporphyrinogen III oxidase family protein [Planctomycetales bacterium]